MQIAATSVISGSVSISTANRTAETRSKSQCNSPCHRSPSDV